MLGGIFADADLLYLYLLNATPQHHHTYWPHLPIAWLGCGLMMWIAARHRDAAFRQALAAFLLGWLSHLLPDSITGDIWWLYPLIDKPIHWRTLTPVSALVDEFYVALEQWRWKLPSLPLQFCSSKETPASPGAYDCPNRSHFSALAASR